MNFRCLALPAILLAGLLCGCSPDRNQLPTTPGPGDTSSASRAVQTGQEAVVRNEQGIQIAVLPTTVPTDTQGNPGTLVFSIEPSSASAAAPDGYSLIGRPWQLGPEGIHFAGRCRVSMPAPETNAPYLLARFEPETRTWRTVTTSNDPADPGRVSADVLHLSVWGLLLPTATSVNPTACGAIRVRNVDGTRAVSICLKEYELKYPLVDTNFDPEAVGAILTEAGHNGGVSGVLDHCNLILPQGRFVFELTRYTPVPSLLPTAPDGWIETESYRVDEPWIPGTEPPVEMLLNPSSWVQPQLKTSPMQAPCEGQPDLAFGTGAVQITLTWDQSVDLDLHVVEPSAEEIYFGHSVSATGGKLDRDRTCNNPGSRDPENIFWPNSGAPSGTYTVKVRLWGFCNANDSGTVPFRVRTVVDGVARTFSGSVALREMQTVTTFTR
jgi:hypothetical protein